MKGELVLISLSLLCYSGEGGGEMARDARVMLRQLARPADMRTCVSKIAEDACLSLRPPDLFRWEAASGKAKGLAGLV